MEIEYHITTWKEIVKKIYILCDKIKESGFQPDVLVSILRGGAPVTALLSDCLGVTNIASIRIMLYKGIAKPDEEAQILQPLAIDVRGKKVLIVDDVADTGKTLIVAKNHVADKGASEIKIATIHMKPWSKIVPDYYVEVTDRWIVYPWEYHEFIREISMRLEKGDFSETEARKASDALALVKRIVEEILR